VKFETFRVDRVCSRQLEFILRRWRRRRSPPILRLDADQPPRIGEKGGAPRQVFFEFGSHYARRSLMQEWDSSGEIGDGRKRKCDMR
jgi:hypothetical protein